MNIYTKVLSILFVVCSAKNESEFEKLVNLVEKNIKEAQNYKLPVDNSEAVKTNTNDFFEYGRYDFIIVGAGTAGSVLANKLSANKKWRILLLEAGDDDDDFSDIPGMSVFVQKSRMNWGYYTTPQNSCCQGMVNKQCNFPRGKVLGGSGTINGLVYTRGNPEDYDRWVTLGNTGWSQKEVLPYFVELENWQTYGDLLYHGMDGPLNCNHTRPDLKIFPIFLNALAQKGQYQVDYNAKSQLGVSRIVYNVNYNKRVSGSTAFLRNIQHIRENLDISKNSFVTKILIDKNPKIPVANGVQFIKNNITYIAIAKKEVIISAGAINSPQILMLSGIGPSAELKKHQIELIKDLPVGKNLQDHPIFIGFNIRTNMSYVPANLTENLRRYLNAAKPLTAGLPGEAIGFLKFRKHSDGIPDVEYIMNAASKYDDLNKFFYNTNEYINSYMEESKLPSDIFVYIILLHGKSRGEVTLKSKTPADFPNINVNFLSDRNNEDIQMIYTAITYFENLLNTAPMRKINATLLPPNTVCGQYKKLSKGYWYCVIRQLTMSTYHPVGTTRMGRYSNDSVVNRVLKIHGVNNLRVVDAGVMPEIISGHTNAPTFMIASKIADTIIMQYSVK